jgi:hypothetical protein
MLSLLRIISQPLFEEKTGAFTNKSAECYKYNLRFVIVAMIT